MYPPQCRPSSKLQMCLHATTTRMPRCGKPSRSTGDDTALLGKRHRIIRREVGSSECKEEAADYSKSEAELVEVEDTLESAIFERTESEGDQFPVSSKRHKFFCARSPVTPKGLRVLWCELSVNGLSYTVCGSHSIVHLLFLAASVISMSTPHHLKFLCLHAR